MPPELLPQIARPFGSSVILYCLATSGRISVSRNVAYASETVSYSTDRLLGRNGRSRFSPAFGGGFFFGSFPGLMNTPIVTGIAFWWIRLSNTTGARVSPFSLTGPDPSWNTIRAAGVLPSYWSGTYTHQSRSVPG